MYNLFDVDSRFSFETDIYFDIVTYDKITLKQIECINHSIFNQKNTN